MDELSARPCSDEQTRPTQVQMGRPDSVLRPPQLELLPHQSGSSGGKRRRKIRSRMRGKEVKKSDGEEESQNSSLFGAVCTTGSTGSDRELLGEGGGCLGGSGVVCETEGVPVGRWVWEESGRVVSGEGRVGDRKSVV